MCGLAGVFGHFGPEHTRRSVEKMLEAQAHRGPDSTGMWWGVVNGMDIAVGLRRLKILDLSDAANQPMVSEDGRFVLVFNGEIYNYLELKEELAALDARFHTRGDTEVLLQALIRWGIGALPRLNGMWAILFLDLLEGELLLSRDRFGVKPLYLYRTERGLFASSEIKAILQAVGARFGVCPSVANAYLRQSLLCASTRTFFSGIEEFPAGHYAQVSLRELSAGLAPRRYWKTPIVGAEGSAEQSLLEAVRSTFIDSVRIRLRSDVPVGVLLSGGMDSSAIAAAVNHIDPRRHDIELISAVGEDRGRDEQRFIDAVAEHLKRPVHKVVLNYSPAEALELVAEASWFNDEPIGSFATVAHYLLMRKARELGVTVLLSGQGGDETLCGYKKYLGFHLQESIRSGRWLSAARTLQAFARKGTVLSQFNYQEAKRYLPGWLRLPEIDIRGPALLEDRHWVPIGLDGAGVVERQAADIERLSVPALVHYEDRMSMAFGREIRLPFLDYRFVSLLVPLPAEFKLRFGWTKWIFRRAMEPLLPSQVVWRKDKQPFVVPQNGWLRRELREEISRFIDTEWVSERLGLVDRGKFKRLYAAYLRQSSGSGRLGAKDVFAPIALEMWARRFRAFLCV